MKTFAPEPVIRMASLRIRDVLSVTVLTALLSACAAFGSGGPAATGTTARPAEGADRARQLYRIATTTRAGGDAASAVAFYSRASEADPTWIAPVIAIGETAQSIGNAELAVEAYDQALALEEKNLDAHLGKAKGLISLGKIGPALDTLATARPLAGEQDHRVENALGVAHDMLGQHGKAQEHYMAALARTPGNAAIENNLGLSLALSGDFQDAVKVLCPLATGPAATARARQNLALAYGLAGDESRAAAIARLDLPETAVASNLALYRDLRALPQDQRVRRILGAATTAPFVN